MGERGEEFELWYMRLMAMLEGRDFSRVVYGTEEPPSSESSPRYSAYTAKLRKARATLVNALGDKPLHGVQLSNMPKDKRTKL